MFLSTLGMHIHPNRLYFLFDLAARNMQCGPSTDTNSGEYTRPEKEPEPTRSKGDKEPSDRHRGGQGDRELIECGLKTFHRVGIGWWGELLEQDRTGLRRRGVGVQYLVIRVGWHVGGEAFFVVRIQLARVDLRLVGPVTDDDILASHWVSYAPEKLKMNAKHEHCVLPSPPLLFLLHLPYTSPSQISAALLLR